MYQSRIKVGQPLDGFKRKKAVGSLKWRSATSVSKERASKLSLRTARKNEKVKSISAHQTEPALTSIADSPLQFMSIGHFFALAAIALVAVMLVWGMVRANNTAVALSYDISSLTQHRIELLDINRQLKTEVTQMSSLGQLEEAAVKSLNLVVPRQGQIVVIE